ncbi:MAG: response regulator receiver domain [bacterium]|nr:response regulator receiver domain [bacterium]
MAQTFNEITRNIVDRFLQNILFVDDNAYQTEEKVNAFDAHEISSIFAQKGKLCTIFAPATTGDIGFCNTLFSKSDVVVLDWYLRLKDPTQLKDLEADAEDDEPRGVYTKEMIKNIMEDASDKKLKLIIVYTGDVTILDHIIEEIQETVSIYDTYQIDKKDKCRVYSQNVSILVRAKSNGNADNQLKYNDDLKSKILDYKNLPDFISEEFSIFVGGLLPDFALSAIAAIRNNTSNILGVFSKDIDPAFLGHYVSIPDCNDAIPMMSGIFGSAITDLINSENFNLNTWIDTWLTQNYKQPLITKIGKNNVEVKESDIRNIVNSSESKFKDKLKKAGFNISGGDDELKKDATKLFIVQSDTPNYKLAKLIQHSNLFSPSKAPRLTTGTIVKYKKSTNWNYLLCIQQRCDSVRVPKKGRTFLFLPLTQDKTSTAIVVGENDHMFVKNESHSIELHEFVPNNDNEPIIARQYKQIGYAFKDKIDKYYVWVAELKEMFAQHIVAAYTSQLSRVGIDNSEWIRLVGK